MYRKWRSYIQTSRCNNIIFCVWTIMNYLVCFVLFSLLGLSGTLHSVEAVVAGDHHHGRSLTSWGSKLVQRIFRRSNQGQLPKERDGFEIVEETLVYSGWRTILQRKIKMRNGKVVDFDLVGVKTGGGAVLIFAWDTQTKTATLVREYMPGSHKIMWGIAAGLVEDKHGADVSKAARDELEEEAQLTGGEWIPLSVKPSAMDKYALMTIDAYLVLDPTPAENPKSMDDEEDIEVVRGVSVPDIMRWIATGEMNMVSAWGCMLAIEKLRELGEYP